MDNNTAVYTVLLSLLNSFKNEESLIWGGRLSFLVLLL